LLILGFKDLINDRTGTLNRVCEFIGAEIYDWNKINLHTKNKRKYSKTISNEDLIFINKYYEKYNQQLFEEYGMINW
jgi:hypothetical protein